MSPEEYNLYPAEQVVEQLRAYVANEVDTYNPTELVFFQRVINRLDEGPKDVDARGVIVVARYAEWDLLNGKDGTTGELLQGPAVGRPYEEYRDIADSLPRLFESAGQEELAAEIQKAADTIEEKVREEIYSDAIKEDITSLAQAENEIIASSRQIIERFPSQIFGTSTDKALDIFDISVPILLTNSDIRLPIGVAKISNEQDNFVLMMLDDDRKRQLIADNDTFWLAMLDPVIPAEMATFMKDYLINKVLLIIGQEAGADMQTFNEAVQRSPDKNAIERSAERYEESPKNQQP